MVEYRIIENPDPAYYERYEEFIELYNNKNITVEDIRKKLGWRVKVYNDARRKALKEGRIVDRRSKKSIENCKGRPVKPKRNPKYYYYDRLSRKFIIKKHFYPNNEEIIIYFGKYENKESAEKVVSELKKVGWDKNELVNIKRRLGLL